MAEKFYERFRLYHRINHGLLIVSFLGLALTGLPLKFSHMPWARPLSLILGGPLVTRYLHRLCAVILLAVVVMHFAHLFRLIFVERRRGVFWGPDSMVPQPSDAVDLFRHVRWFLGLGDRPAFGRYTYWEKFDYWAVFWGVAIIGTSGLFLWFPGFFSRFFPGGVFNLATLIHSDEALLAVGFIFTIHFFNGHFRPKKFPLDRVMFTGRVSESEMLDERPKEFEVWKTEGRLADREIPPTPPGIRLFATVVGFTALGIGLVLMILIVISYLT